MITDQIQSILDEIHNILRSAIGPRNRAEYMKSKYISGRDWHFSLTAEDIINQKIPAAVIGCTGIARLFCKLANDIGLKCWVVCNAYEPDWIAAKSGEKRTISGHQAIAVNVNGKLCMFHPGRHKLEFVDADVIVGNKVDFGFCDVNGLYIITAIMKPTDYAKIDTYQKLRNIYASGDINNPNFTIVPK